MIFGCYVGDVFVRNGKARWIDVDDSSGMEQGLQPVVLEIVPRGHTTDPLTKVLKRFLHGDDDSVAFYYKAVSLL